MAKLSETQIKALRLAETGPLVRWKGGFWSRADMDAPRKTWPHGDPIPSEYVEIRTLQSLEKKGLMNTEARDVFQRPTRFALAEAGRTALLSQGEQNHE